MYFILFAIPSIIVSMVGFYIYQKKNEGHSSRSRWHRPDDITIKELVISLTVNLAFAAIGILLIKGYVAGQMYDTYTVVGKVTGKSQEWVSCEHSYTCNCREVCSGSGESRSCTTQCDTCYEHSNDWDWRVNTTVGDLNIARVDRRGIHEPQRWTDVVIGEPAADTRSYLNYLLADESSLFMSAATPAPISRPSVHDYYRFNHVVGGDKELAHMVSEWAVHKAFTPIVVITKNKESSYFDSVVRSFNGGKMNDVVLVYSVGDDNKVQWMNVGTYALNYKNNMMVSDVINLSLGQEFTNQLVIDQLNKAHGLFVQVPNTEFEEKKHLVPIPWYVILTILVLNVALSIGIHVYMARHEV